jgi:Uma2 family endonuclease
MAEPAPAESRYTVERYLALVAQGVITPADRVELLDGVIVAMPPANPAHDAAVAKADDALRQAIGMRAAIRVQMSFLAGSQSLVEPDVAVVPGRNADYETTYPSIGLLIVEVADSSLLQDRLTKAALYAAAAVPEYWIVSLPGDCVEIFRSPEPQARRYARSLAARRGDRLEIVSLPGATVAVDDLLPGR